MTGRDTPHARPRAILLMVVLLFVCHNVCKETNKVSYFDIMTYK